MNRITMVLIGIMIMVSGCTETVVESGGATDLPEYFYADEYLEMHPEQVGISDAFEMIVQENASVLESRPEESVDISIIYPGNQVSDYWRRSVDSFTARMNEIGIVYKINEHFTEVGKDIPKQEEAIRSALTNDPDYLIFTIDAKAHQKIIEQIIEQGKTKIILQNITTPFGKWEGNQPMLYVGFDHKYGSELIAREYIDMFDGKGTYGLLYFTQGYVSEMRGDTFIDYLETQSEFELAASYYTDGDRQKSKIAALDLINNNPDIKFIYACSTDVSMGAIDALKELDMLGKIAVNGWGGRKH